MPARRKYRPKRRKKSGNNTASAQWLYILWNFPFVWIVKIGITGYLRLRIKQVGESAPGWDIPIFAIYIPNAYGIEQLIHRLCQPLRIRFYGSGRTERFFILALLPGVLIPLAWAVLLYGSVVLLIIGIIKEL